MTIITVISQQPLTTEQISSFRSVPQGINLTFSGDGTHYLADDGTYKSVVASAAPFISQTYLASENIGGHTVVIMTSGGIAKASSDTVPHASKVLGITYSSVTTGNSVQVVTAGDITEPTWSWVAGNAIYLSTNGTLTQTPPTSGFILQLGTALTATSMNLNLRFPIIL